MNYAEPDGTNTAPSHVRLIADPLTAQSKRFGETFRTAKAQVADIESTLRELDTLTENLSEQGVRIDWSLGPVGDAAAAARRTLVEHDARHATTFELPRGA